jgi:hypothetical protein
MSETVRLHIDIVLGIHRKRQCLLSPTRENPYLQVGRAIYPGVCRSTALIETKLFTKAGVTRLISIIPRTGAMSH